MLQRNQSGILRIPGIRLPSLRKSHDYSEKSCDFIPWISTKIITKDFEKVNRNIASSFTFYRGVTTQLSTRKHLSKPNPQSERKIINEKKKPLRFTSNQSIETILERKLCSKKNIIFNHKDWIKKNSIQNTNKDKPILQRKRCPKIHLCTKRTQTKNPYSTIGATAVAY
jgi:hypothetical protein